MKYFALVLCFVLAACGDSGARQQEKKAAPAATVRKFEKLIASKTRKQFSPTKLVDKHTDDLLKLVKKKEKQRGNVVRIEAEAETDHKVVDLVQILKKSLGGKK